MACEDHKKRKCFTFIWKVENAEYWWKKGEHILSPSFTIEEIDETIWKLRFYLYFEDIYQGSKLCLQRHGDNKNIDKVEIDSELAFLSCDGTVWHSVEKKNLVFKKNDQIESEAFPSRHEVFHARRSLFLLQDTLTIRCRIWKSNGEISKDVQYFALTRIAVEKRVFLWNIDNFSTLKSNVERTHQIKSLGNGGTLMSLKLFLTGGLISEETIRLKVVSNNQNIRLSSLQLSIVDATKNTMKCFVGEFWFRDSYDIKDSTLFYTKNGLMEKKSIYLPNDVLSLLCECSFCFGTIVEEIESSSSNLLKNENIDQDERCLANLNVLSVPEGILINDFKSLLNNDMLSDVKLKSRSKKYAAHKLILSARSPVFKAMFSSEMKEKVGDCVDIDDLSDGTLLNMLRYIYSADVGELDWEKARELYAGADKYQIVVLKDICSSFLKEHLCQSNACDALVLADLHQDHELKNFVQGFILRHGKDIIISEEWDQLMETHLNLAAETMRQKFKELPN